MKIFITGIAGFLGSHIAEAMLYECCDVVGCDDFSGGEISNLPTGVQFHEIRCQDLTPDYFDGVDVVYHCAALAHEGLSVFSPKVITESIYGASVAVFSAAIAAGVKRIVYCSSMSRYGDNPVPFTEDMTPRPQDPYAVAKVAAEETLKILCKVHGVDYVIAVPHNIVGPRQKYDDPFRNVAAIMINLMLQGRQPYVYGDGTQARCFSDIRDVVPCFVKMGLEDKCVGETINVGPDEEFVSINELVAELQAIIDPGLTPVYLKDRPQEVKHATCSSDKARMILDYRTQYRLHETLESMVDWVERKGVRSFQYHLPLEIRNEKMPESWAEELF